MVSPGPRSLISAALLAIGAGYLLGLLLGGGSLPKLEPPQSAAPLSKSARETSTQEARRPPPGSLAAPALLEALAKEEGSAERLPLSAKGAPLPLRLELP